MSYRFKNTLRYVLPSVAAMVVSFLYVVVDGIFVGNGVGANALAAVNIAVPFTTMTTAVAAMVTMGGAAVYAVRIGRNEPGPANDAFLLSTYTSLGLALVLMLLGVCFPTTIARLSGSSDALLEDTVTYIRYFSMFALFASFDISLSNFIRNDGRPGLSFVGMTIGAATNIFLDWLFVFPLQMGIKGAAIASGLGQILSMLVLLSHFVTKRGSLRFCRFKPSWTLAKKIFVRGTPELITQLSQPVTILCYNFVVIRMMGELGVAAYSVICYMVTLILGVFIGVSQGLQPLIGQSFGRNCKEDERYYSFAGVGLNLAFSTGIYLLLLLGGRSAIGLFNPDPQLIELGYEAFKLYGFSFIPASVNIVLIAYFFATKHSGQAIIVSALRSFVLNSLLIFTMPALFGVQAIWLPMVVAEILTLVIGLCMVVHVSKKEAGGAALPTTLPNKA